MSTNNNQIEGLKHPRKHQIASRENPESEKIWGQAIESRWKAKREAAAAKEAVVAMNNRKNAVHIKSHKLKSSKSLGTKTVMKPFNGHGRRSSIVSDHKKERMQRVKSQLEQKKGRSKIRQGSTGALVVDADVLRLAIQRHKCHRCKNCYQKLRDWRIYPNSTVETIWILFTTFFVCWTSLMLPVTVAFISANNRPVWWQIIDVSADVFYITDGEFRIKLSFLSFGTLAFSIYFSLSTSTFYPVPLNFSLFFFLNKNNTVLVVLNFRAVYLDTWGAMITESPKIAQHYMFGASGTSIGWFWIDFPASIPWNLFISDNMIGIRDAGYMFNLPKLARLFHLPTQFSKLPCIKQGANTGRITKLFSLFIMVAHWFGCLWYLAGSLEEAKASCYKYQSANSDGACSWIDASDASHLPKEHLYVRSLYWAIATMTSVGYGDISPINRSETIVCGVIMLIGAAMYATIFSNMASYIQSIDTDVSNFQQKMNDVRQQMTYLKIPDELSSHIEMYYNYMWTCHKGLVEHQQYFYKDLPNALNLEISMHLFRDTVSGVALFAGCSEAFLREVVLNLEPQVCIPGEYIVNKNDVARAMFFITRGEVEVLDNFEGRHLAFLRAPQYFGETAILEARRRTASIQALTYADLYCLLAASMQVILKSFKVDDERIHMNALQFLNHGKITSK